MQKSGKILVMEFFFGIFKLKYQLFQRYLILTTVFTLSTLTSKWLLLWRFWKQNCECIFIDLCRFSLHLWWYQCERTVIMTIQDENMRIINFILKWNSVSTNFLIKESTWIFLTKLCHYHLSEDSKVLCTHYQKRSQQYAEEKSIFLRCEDLKVSWDLNWFNWIYKRFYIEIVKNISKYILVIQTYCMEVIKNHKKVNVFHSSNKVFLAYFDWVLSCWKLAV